MGQPILAATGFQPVRLAFCSLLCAAALCAQPDDKPAAEWIRSAEPVKQAWAAHWIEEAKLSELGPGLLRVIESTETSADADAAKFAALDALIQLKAEVPLSDLEPLVDRFPTDVLILAARSHEDASSLLLKLLDRQHNREAFVAVGDLLTPKRNTGFAKAAMKEFCQAAMVWVYNPGQPQTMGSGWNGDSLAKTDTPRPDWPEVGSYRIYPGGGHVWESWAPLASGPHAVYCVRTLSQGYADHGFDPSGEGSNDNSCLRAEEFLAMYLETSTAQLPVRSAATLNLVWTTPEAFEAAVHGFIAAQRARYGLLAAQLAARGYLTAKEASEARLNLRGSAQDVRQHDRTPLPDVRGEWAKGR